MHFWIDKRSQQCGFGRSRVAASLSGAGGAGVGLGFGHPPRRITSNKTSTRSILPECHHSASTSSSTSTSRTHQYQHHQSSHQPHQQQQPPQQHASNNNSFNNDNNCQHNTHNTSNISSNSNSSNVTAPSNVSTGAIATMQSNLNNNPHQCHPYHYHQYHHSSVNSATTTNNAPNTNVVNNNNSSSASSSTATLIERPNLAPTASHNVPHNQRGAATAQQSATVSATNAQVHQQPGHYYDLRNYHHPQFGNMTLRHYQYPARNCGTSHTTTNMPHTAYRLGSGNGSNTNNIAQASRGASVGCAALTAHPASLMPHNDQSQYRTQYVYSHATAELAGDNSAIIGGSAPVTTNTTNTTSYAVANTTQRYNQSAINMCTNNMSANSNGVQFFPCHLTFGSCASLVLAAICVAAAKFYFDHHPSLEALIFCVFSATFFLATCTVSLCRVPISMLPGNRPGMLSAQTHDAAGGGMHCARTSGLGRREINSDNGVELIGADDIHGAPLCGQLQLIEDSATAGPPPYHVAIYFPETENRGKTKESPTDDESPPPSYDKILI